MEVIEKQPVEVIEKQPVEVIENKLEISRLELLDMGLRGNSLLHCRAGARTLEVVDELSAEIYDILVEKQKSMTFVPVPEELVDEESGDVATASRPLPELLEEMYGTGRHTDTKLQTKLISDVLDRRLLKISTEAVTYSQEQGVDILYISLGFLTWYEDNNSDTPRRAPLVLIPVELKRSSAKERFKVRYSEADLGANLTLASKLKMEFRVNLPEFDDEFDIDAYFSAVRESISSQLRWVVNANDIGLGFFSFGKFQMYQDLNPDNWPEDKKPGAHKMLASLLGNGFSQGNSSSGREVDGEGDVSEPSLIDLHFVKDADSSQTEAVMAVKQGSNLVIQGPPGTGKSQTITNIISESLADGKTVLFVAEKMAALEVVKRRLDECHLGDAVLELHSHKSNKRSVLEELKRCLDLGSPAVKDRSHERARHTHLTAQLDAYSAAVNESILNSGVTYIDALGHNLQLQEQAGDVALPKIDFEQLKNWDERTYANACSLVTELCEHLTQMGTPADSPFSTSSLEEFSPVAQNEISNLLSGAVELVELLRTNASSLASEMSLSEPKSVLDILTICRAAQRAVDAPHLAGLKLTTDDWQQRRDQISALLEAGGTLSCLREKHTDTLIDQAWKADVLSARQAWTTTGRHWWRFLSGDFRGAKRQLQGLLNQELPKSVDSCVEIIDDILSHQAAADEYCKGERIGEALFGAQWQGEKSNWKVLRKLTDWIVDLYEQIGREEIPRGILGFLEGASGQESWVGQLQELEHGSRDLTAKCNRAMELLQIDRIEADNADVNSISLALLAEHFSSWLEQIDSLYLMTRYNRLKAPLQQAGLDDVLNMSYEWRFAPDLLLVALKISWYSGLVDEAYRKRDALKAFDRLNQENVIQEFRALDKELFHHAQESLVDKLHAQMPQISAAGEVAIIRREMNKKRRHLAIRKLISQAGRAIQQIKPVFMMGPMSVATYLEQGAVEFDLVVFDEASQVKVVDALGSILRGKQVVVVGDTKQMPPSDFFGKTIELDDEEAEESQTADVESILGMFLTQGAPESMLRWHYRSRHDSLITVSNQEFYDNKLMIFPSPGVNPQAKGLKLNINKESIYERGTSATNPIEARIVAEAVMHHARTEPRLTLGVVAFSTKQRDCILFEIERLRREDPSCEAFFNIENLEGFFVKNLENVQGDERDVIYISMGYGRMASGRVTQRFPLINCDGGERRLNVLITRARLAMEVFANFTADELKTVDFTPFGVRALKNFLAFAETGALLQHHETGRDTDSPFEDEVLQALRRLGYQVEPQVGSAGFYLDIAVRDPSKPGRYILAVECDGATYHSSASARDRDRLRQDVLEDHGWRFHRIWSTDWFRNPAREVERLKLAVESSVAFYAELDSGVVASSVDTDTQRAPVQRVISRSEKSAEEPTITNPYRVFNEALNLPQWTDITELNKNDVVQAIRRIVEREGPLHVKEAARRITEDAGYTRVGNRILGFVEKAAKLGHQTDVIYLEKEFLFADSGKQVEIRDRSELPASQKKIELVPAEEIQLALTRCVEMAYSLSGADAVSEALSLLGFRRSTAKAKEIVESELTNLTNAQKLKVNSGLVTLAVNT